MPYAGCCAKASCQQCPDGGGGLVMITLLLETQGRAIQGQAQSPLSELTGTMVRGGGLEVGPLLPV